MDSCTIRGVPAHYALLRRVWQAREIAREGALSEELLADDSDVGVIIFNRAHASLMSLDLLLHELVHECVEHDLACPREISLYSRGLDGEG